MSENSPSGIPVCSAVNTQENLCRLILEFDRRLNTFRFSGIIDAGAQPILDGLVQQIEHPFITFDFAGVTRVNSMGVALLLRCFKQIKDEMYGDIRLSNLSPVNAMLFKITGIFLLATPENVTGQKILQ